MRKKTWEDPKTKLGGEPLWAQKDCMGISVKSIDVNGGVLILGNNRTASVSICWDKNFRKWVLNWRITHCQIPLFEVKGQIYLGNRELKAAFGLGKISPDYFGEEILKSFGGTTCRSMKFIFWEHPRYLGKYVNIPGPGTGGYGDPNISIFISDEIQRAVKELTG